MIDPHELSVGDLACWEREPSRRFIVTHKNLDNVYCRYLDNQETFHTNGFQPIVNIAAEMMIASVEMTVEKELSIGDLCRYMDSSRRFIIERWSTIGVWCRYLDNDDQFHLRGRQPIMKISVCWWKGVV